MSRTTPPRPVDIASLFPELAPLARQAVRLHPRAGAPTVHDSSVGGPLLWPSDEPWPTCAREHLHGEPPVSLTDVRRRRALLEAAWLRDRGPTENLLTASQRAHLDELETGHPPHTGPNALLPVAQLHLRDVPFTDPEGADLLQVLWCPFDHDDEGLPATRLVRRRAADVGELLTDPPEPADVEHYGHYVPEPCVLHPETVTEYPAPLELPKDLADRLHAWGEQQTDAEPGSAYYQYELSVAPGWKLGGWGPWSFRNPAPMHCPTCAAEYRPFLTIPSDEWDGGSGRWIPLEDRIPPTRVGLRSPSNPPMVEIGRGYAMQIYTCPTAFDHPHLEVMQ